MSNQHQYGLLPCKLQGGVNHETTGRRPYLVRINRVLHVVDIHTPDPESPVRSRLKDGYREVTATRLTNPGGK